MDHHIFGDLSLLRLIIADSELKSGGTCSSIQDMRGHGDYIQDVLLACGALNTDTILGLLLSRFLSSL